MRARVQSAQAASTSSGLRSVISYRIGEPTASAAAATSCSTAVPEPVPRLQTRLRARAMSASKAAVWPRERLATGAGPEVHLVGNQLHCYFCGGYHGLEGHVMSISRRQWSLDPHSFTEFIALTWTLSWKPREANT